MHGPPNSAIGRPMKVGKEEMVGLVAAVDWYLSLDEPSLVKRYERQVARVRMTSSFRPAELRPVVAGVGHQAGEP